MLAPVLLTVLRCVQGFALGGEWGGAVLIVSEHGDPRTRGFWASLAAGGRAGRPAARQRPAGLPAPSFQSDEAFLAWGWRIPFLLSAVLVLVGLWVRLPVEESPVFREASRARRRRAAAGVMDKMPILAVLRALPARGAHRDGRPDGRERLLLHLHHRHPDYATTQLGLGKSVRARTPC